MWNFNFFCINSKNYSFIHLKLFIMKRLLIAICCVISSFCVSEKLFGQKDINATTKIDKITVFINNAQIERSSSINLPAGNSTIVLSGISQYIDVNSLRVSGKGSFVIMSQEVQIKYPEPVVYTEEPLPNHVLKGISNLTDSLELLAFDISENNSKKEELIIEKNYLQSSAVISKADTITELKDGLEYFRIKMNDINQEWVKLMKNERLLLKKKNEMDARLLALKNYSKGVTPPKNEALPEAVISIQVMADKAVAAAEIDISYICSNVSWTPFYELRVEEVSKPVQLVMKANLTQNTGEDWEKAKLVFSTGVPAAYKVLPVLPVWYLYYYTPQRVASTYAGAAPVAALDYESRRKESKQEDDAYIMSDYVQLTQSLISAEYVVSIPYNISSDGKVHTITLMNEPLTATYKFLSVPKMDKDVFLTAYLMGWEKLNLVPGEANIVYQNSIISKTYINTGGTMDTLIVSLGVDKRVVVDRKKISDKSKDKVIGSTRERTVHFEITVKNQNQSEIAFVLKDQVPVTQTEDIKIIVEEISGAKYDELTGELVWNLKLKPNETKKLDLRYTIKHDKDKTVICE